MVSKCSFALPRIALLNRLHFEFCELFRIHRTGGAGHQVIRALCLREGDDISDRFRVCREHREPVHSHRDSTVRRCSVRKGVEEEPELISCFLLAKPDHREDSLLYFRVVQADGATGNFKTIEDEIIAVRQHLAWILFEEVNAIVLRPGETWWAASQRSAS